jgi:deoxycytidylate deaminase
MKMDSSNLAVRFAINESRNSKCRSKRGAAVWHPCNPSQIIAGHNHLPTGHCTNDDACKATCGKRAIHAEQDAILIAGNVPEHRFISLQGAQMLHVKTVDGILVPSGGPSCLECAKLILASGIDMMWLYHADGWTAYDAHTFYMMSIDGATVKALR